VALELVGLTQVFGGVCAVQDLSFRVAVGECVALIGPNGAGKSTTFACIAGQQVPRAGSVRWRGLALTALTPAQRLQHGVVRTFQQTQSFETLSALQSVQLLLRSGTAALRAFDVLDDYASDQAMDLLGRVGLGAAAQQRVASLPYGARKRLELAQALAGAHGQSGPVLLLLDEPAAGLSKSERASLMQLVRSMARSQNALAVLFTEHHMDVVFDVADRVLVLVDGRLIAQGSPAEVAAHGAVRSRYLGASFSYAAGAPHA